MSVRALLWLLLAGIGYVILPVDLIPDVPGIGWLDDLLVIGALFYLLVHSLPRPGSGPAGDGEQATAGAEAAAPGAEAPDGYAERFRSADPHVVLGVARSASAGEVKQAYRELLAQYHPDKVTHLSPEFQALAHERAVAIQQAYGRVAGT